jgi:flagellar biosynthesis/type III secretory pathway protein FliH
MLESPLIDDLVMEKYGDVIAEKTREAHEAREAAREAAQEAAREAAQAAREAAQEAAQEAAREAARESIVAVLEARFGDLPSDLLKQIATVVDQKDLKQLVRATGICRDLDAFRDLFPRD